jgi:hypothetical protein
MSFGKAEAEWVFPAYTSLAGARNTWKIPFSDIIYVMAKRHSTAHPTTLWQKAKAWIDRKITRRVPELMDRNFVEGIRVYHINIGYNKFGQLISKSNSPLRHYVEDTTIGLKEYKV